jgi:pimeloyl-ACP methyl ester carboxylesterase
LLLTVPAQAEERVEHRIVGGAGVLAIHEIKPSTSLRRNFQQRTVLLLHGGGPGGVVQFDLPQTRPGFAARLAAAGHHVYMLDLRGWGDSTKPAAMDAPPTANKPLVPVDEAVADIDSAVQWIRGREGVGRVAIVGAASGGHWAGAYAARYPTRVSHLVMLNSLYGGSGPWVLSDSVKPPLDAYRFADLKQLVARWVRDLPEADSWRFATEAYAAETIATDATATTRTPPSVRIPLGYLDDAWRMAHDERVFDAGRIHAHILFVRGSKDFWSRPVDAENIAREATRADSVRVVEIPGALHFLVNDRPDRGLDRFTQDVLEFLGR